MSENARRIVAIVAGVVLCAVAFTLALTHSLEFAVSGRLRDVLGSLPPREHAAYMRLISHLPIYEDPAAWFVRKAASVVFFGTVGAVARIVAGRRITSASRALLVVVGAAVAMSLAIEIYEYPESIGDEAFDLACGAVGGLIAAGAMKLFRAL